MEQKKSTLSTANLILVVPIFLLSTLLLSLFAGSLFINLDDSSAADMGLGLDVGLLLSITSSDAIAVPIAATATGTQNAGTVQVSVTTNNPIGYSLTMSSATAVTALALTSNPATTIPSTTAPIASPSVLANNTWGYSTAASPASFARIPASATPDTLLVTGAPSVNSITGVTFAARVNTTKPAGTYANTIIFTATAN